ncbi:Hypoxic response protein 1 [Thermus thermophilus]|uniref:Hypoxic response protein 1 n=1 Tax=Thermus thermophilus TaxID=274 RepID=A0A3P4ATD4_THETH|nr:DUF294 nucleotidyltransferase-like domain-containing protein [Thermus thermophilus]VCU53183.1 Hypoxic response protein 1 [Thermus thermophilus]
MERPLPPPLDALPEEAVRAFLARGEEVAAEEGEVLLEAQGPPATHLYLVLEGEVALEEEGEEVERLGPGSFFGYPSLLSGASPVFTVRARGKTRLLRFPKEAFETLLAYPEAARFFGRGVAERLRLRPERVLEPGLARPVGELVQRPPVFVDPTASVEEAARRMREEGISSLLVRGEPLGILTDRDLRNRVLAEGLPPSTPVGQVATRPTFTLPADTPLLEAVAAMLERRIHHLPLTRGEAVVGVVTHTDLLAHQAQSPLALLRRVERLELGRYGEEVARLVAGLFQAGVPALEIGRVVAGLNDALIRRLLQEAERALGPPPVPYAFFVFGSEGRKEQALLTDQDNALALAEEGHEAYFQALAERVVEGLVAAGIPPCPGGYMATRWRLSLARWQEVFARWMEAPEPQALLDAQIFFDLRPVGGTLSLAPLERLIQEKAKSGVFLYHLAQAALAFRPPLGLFGRVRTEEGFLDLKRHALAPIVSLARVYALMTGSPARRTTERLKQGVEKGALSLELAEKLEEAYAFFFHLRLKAQLQALKEGRPPGNRVVYKALSPLERRRATEGFRAILEAQEALALRFQIRL